MKKILIFLVCVLTLNAISLDEKVAYLNNVKELIVLTQKMRGDTNVYTQGGKIDKAVVEADRKAYALSFKALQTKFKSVDTNVNEEFKKLNNYMVSLNGVAIELDNLTAFKANTLLIKEMLRIGAQVQENFFQDENVLRKQASAMMMKRILPLMEHLGQLRGLSAGAMACHNCKEDADLEHIKDYLAHTDDGVNNFVEQMKGLKKTYAKHYAQNLDLKLDAYKKEVHTYLYAIKSLVLESKKGNTEVYDFFKEGTKLIEKTLKFYDINEKALKN